MSSNLREQQSEEPNRRRALPCHRGFYRLRRKVENCFCRLKRFRRITNRDEKWAESFIAFVHFAVALEWLTHQI